MLVQVSSLPGWADSTTGPLLAQSIRGHTGIFIKILEALRHVEDEKKGPTNRETLDKAEDLHAIAQELEVVVGQRRPGALPAAADQIPYLSPLTLTALTTLEVLLPSVDGPSEALLKDGLAGEVVSATLGFEYAG
ncbi:MAG: hypothetical protein M1826_005774 [Phylliscum demangeonii]|nr:MAG: hypothetical protein M1826_005774 [Phylliscum demangeonii]